MSGTLHSHIGFGFMARYFFDLHESDGVELDEVGIELPDQAAAEKWAIHTMGSIASDYHVPGNTEEFQIKVRVEVQEVFAVNLKLEVMRRS